MPRPKKTEEEKRERRNTYARNVYHKYKENREEKMLCDCGAMISRAYIADHKKKKKHFIALEFVNKLKEELTLP